MLTLWAHLDTPPRGYEDLPEVQISLLGQAEEIGRGTRDDKFYSTKRGVDKAL